MNSRTRAYLAPALLLAALLLALLRPAAGQSGGGAPITVQIKLLGQTNPSVSRFVGFTGVIPRESAHRLDRASLRFFVNGIDRTFDLQIEKDPQKGDLYLAFRPSQALPLGTVVQRIVGTTVDGRLFDKEWSFQIDQSADPVLAPWAQLVRENDHDVNAHMQLAAAYESKYLLDDAAAEYLVAIQIDPESEKARNAYMRIFSAWDRKSITQEKVCIEVIKDLGLEKMGALILYKLRIFNGEIRKISVDPNDAILVIDDAEEVPPLESLRTYPKEAYESGRITIENYARLTYFLENHPIGLVDKRDISPGVISEGYLAYPLKRKFFKRFSLTIPVKSQGKSLSFRFPFTGP